MSRNCTYDLGVHTSDEEVFEFSVAREHFRMDFLVAVSMEWHRRNSHFPCPPPQSGVMAQRCFQC